MSTNSHPELLESIEALRAELARLNDRVASLEERLAGSSPRTVPETAVVDKDVILIIAAAVAGFLGKKAPIRQIRLLGSEAWAQQGRVTIQASHVLSRRG